jgi:hypothetical protein
MPPAKLGTASSTSLGASCPSDCAIGLTTVIRFDRWYKVVSHGRYVTFQLAEVAVPRELFRKILSLIDDLRPRPAPA